MKKLFIIVLLFNILLAKWNAEFSLGFDFTKVNDDSITELLGSGRVSYKSNLAGSIMSEFDLVNTEKTWVKDYMIGFDFGYILNKRFKLYTVSDFEIRESMNLNYRFSIGAGGKYTYIINDLLKCSISLIPLYNRESYFDGLQFNRSMRLSFRNKIAFSIKKKTIGLRSVMFYKPLVSDWRSYILDFDTSIYFNIYADMNIELKQMFDVDVNNSYNINERKVKFIVVVLLKI